MPNTATYVIVDIISQSHFHGNVKFINAAHTITGGTLFVCDSSGGNFDLTLPDATDYPGRLIVVKQISATNTVTVETVGGQTMDGATSLGLGTQYDSLSLISDGINWHIV